MKVLVDRQMFHEAFRAYNRLDNFSHAARNALFDYFEEYEESCDTEYELDVIAICCEYNEDSIENTLKEYNLESLDELKENTTVIWHDDDDVLYVAY